MTQKIKTNKSIKGFTLIELLTTITIIGILVVFSVPGYVKQNQSLNDGIIQKDIMFVQSYIDEKKVLDQDLLEGLEYESVDNLNQYSENNAVYNRDGASYIEPEKQYKIIPDYITNDEIPTESNGRFLLSDSGDIFYIDNK